jgi:hypothetical protein
VSFGAFITGAFGMNLDQAQPLSNKNDIFIYFYLFLTINYLNYFIGNQPYMFSIVFASTVVVIIVAFLSTFYYYTITGVIPRRSKKTKFK